MKILQSAVVPAENDWRKWIALLRVKPSSELLDSIAATLQDYLQKSGLSCFVLGISGGIDSAFLAALLHSRDIPFCSFSLPLTTNSSQEKKRAEMIAVQYRSSFGLARDLPAVCDFSDLYGDIYARFSAVMAATPLTGGNLQARLRMMFLYHIAGSLGGCVLSTDQLDEFLTGFWTVHGDVGDVGPIQLLPKTTEYALAEMLLAELKNPEPLRAAIEATPTDGLGITDSSLEQLGVASYVELEAIFEEYFVLRQRQADGKCKMEDIARLEILQESVVVRRFLKTAFKRHGSLFFDTEIR